MNASDLAEQLASTDHEKQTELLRDHPHLTGIELAGALKELCYQAWLADPHKTRRIISALDLVAGVSKDPEIEALALWGAGIGRILDGQMRSAIRHFDSSEKRFLSLGRPVAAAETQVGKLYALAVTGNYEEAIGCGLRAREIFLRHGEHLAAGKIEHNLGNLYQRRDRYDKAEHFLRAARQRFAGTSEIFRLIQSDNSLANALAHQHRFREAEKIYQRALEMAEKEDLRVTQAEIESNLGHLLLFEGRFDAALRHFETSRRRFQELSLLHQTAIAEQEIADSYLELNLAPEAAAIYQRVDGVFAELGMNAERARTLANSARARIMLGETKEAHRLLAEAQRLYAAERNFIGEATVRLFEARLFQTEKQYRKALAKAVSAETVFSGENFLSRALQARWLHGECLRLLGENEPAREILQTALEEAGQNFIPQITLLCRISLGLIELSEDDADRAEEHLQKAVSIIEQMRTPLPAEDFRTAFLADKLTAYDQLIRLYLSRGGKKYVRKAFFLSENARSRVLLEMLEDRGGRLSAADPVSAGGSRRKSPGDARSESLREQLNWLYSRLNRLSLEGNFNPEISGKIQEQIRSRENEILEINRKQKIFSAPAAAGRTTELDLGKLQRSLGPETALIEYLILEDEISAFVVTDRQIRWIKPFAAATEVLATADNLRFQIDAMKSVAARRSAFQQQMLDRTQIYLSELHRMLFRPFAGHISGVRDLVIVPQGILHYIPFHALFDGSGYPVESHSISYAPSAGIYQRCLETKKTKFDRAVLVGVEDKLTPQVGIEINRLAACFPAATVLLDREATLDNLRNSSATDVLHLACHGRFRPDNPLFSSLQIYDEWLNVRDAYTLPLDSALVVLSACETGINAVAAGDELLGLTRGFLRAGAAALVLSLWQVDDAATADLMAVFYEKLRLGLVPAAALRFAQLQIMQLYPHPFFWAPFILIGGFRKI